LALASAFFLWHAIHNIEPSPPNNSLGPLSPRKSFENAADRVVGENRDLSSSVDRELKQALESVEKEETASLAGLRILVAIASFDFMQFAHLEEVLDGFQDLCYAGSQVDVVIYTTVVVSLFIPNGSRADSLMMC
jgi:hypothetical protein